jgi:AcrR family transcriptional regulator
MRNIPDTAPSTPAESRRQLKSMERRRRVLAAANRCFSRNGFRKASVDMIAEDAGVSKGLVFSFFGHKDGLFDAVIEQTLTAWTGFAAHQASRFHDQPLLELISMFRGSFEFASHTPMLRVLMANGDREILERLPSLPRTVRDWQGRFADVIQRGITHGVFRADIDPHLASLVIHDVQELYLDQMIDTGNSGYDPDRTEAALMLMVRGLVSAVGERALETQLATSKGGGRKRRS